MDSFSVAAFRSIRLLLSVAENEKKGKKKRYSSFTSDSLLD
jgi:hypothetical protein